MTETTKRGRPHTTPDLDRVLVALTDGKYDDRILEVQEALSGRRNILQEKLRERVREVFGPDADVVISNTSDPSPPVNKNLFVAKAKSSEIDNGSLPGPFKTNPDDGNSYRIADDFGNGMVNITNIFGGNEHLIPKAEWDTWTVELIDDDQETSPPQNRNGDVSLEHRGPIIGGLSTADIVN